MQAAQRALTESQAAERLALSPATLRAWRLQDKGPRFVRLGRAVRYLSDDLDDFLRASMVEPGNGNHDDDGVSK